MAHTRGDAYLTAFTDWLACACAGTGERAPQAVRASGDDLLGAVAYAGAAGHVLDFDDTYRPGVAHVSAATAPAALLLAAELGLSIRQALEAYAEGFEAMAALSAASHPALYEGGWHPTSVCGPIGAATAAARLLELSPDQRAQALAIALLRAGGTRGAFGTDGKAIQVGLAAAAGVQAALMARAGATVDHRAFDGPVGFTAVLGATWPVAADGAGGRPAIEQNWIKLHPSCLGTHAPIEAAAGLPEGAMQGRVGVAVHPVARQAAHLDTVEDGLSAKFSIAYCVAFTLLHGPPRVSDFAAIDVDAAQDATTHVEVVVDDTLPDFGCAISVDGTELARVPSPLGAPERPIKPEQLRAKVRDLTGDRLSEPLSDLDAPAADLAQAAGFMRTAAHV